MNYKERSEERGATEGCLIEVALNWIYKLSFEDNRNGEKYILSYRNNTTEIKLFVLRTVYKE